MKKVISHISHGMGEHATGRPGSDITRMSPKKVTPIEVHSAMRTKSQSGAEAYSGHHASALDSLSGATVPSGGTRSAPGWGNSGARDGNPLAHPPASKVTKVAPPSFGQRSRTAPHSADLGEAILKQAFAASDSGDCQAHGRGRDGTKC